MADTRLRNLRAVLDSFTFDGMPGTWAIQFSDQKSPRLIAKKGEARRLIHIPEVELKPSFLSSSPGVHESRRPEKQEYIRRTGAVIVTMHLLRLKTEKSERSASISVM
jgi:hypothetical protein